MLATSLTALQTDAASFCCKPVDAALLPLRIVAAALQLWLARFVTSNKSAIVAAVTVATH